MRVLFSIIFNAILLYILAFFLSASADETVAAWIVVYWWVKTYIIWWALLWLINITIKPILKILSLPLFFIFLWLVAFIVNWVVLWLLDYIFNQILVIPWVSYTIEWWLNFVIAVAIFTILNMFYSLLFTKK